MDAEIFQQNWGLVVAGVLILIVATFVVITLVRRSAGGQLRGALSTLDTCSTKQKAAHSRAKKTEKKLAALLARSGEVKPRVMEELKGFLSDDRALAKLADDQLLIAKNHVRRIIHDEFPPKKHERLRARYLPDDVEDKKPFSF